MAATTIGAMDMALCGIMTTVLAAVAIGTTSGDNNINHNHNNEDYDWSVATQYTTNDHDTDMHH